MSEPVRTNKGFTLVELLVVMMISGIIMMGVLAVFGNQTRATALQEDYVTLEQNLRAAMDFIHRDSRIAGAYTKDALAPFTIGAIDYDADGTPDFNSEGGGGNPDAIQMRYSPTPGLEIKNYNGAAVNLQLCAPSGLDGICDPDATDPEEVKKCIFTLSSPAPSEVRSIQVTSIGGVSCPGEGCPGNNCDKINFSPGPSALNSPGGLAGAYENGRVWDKLETITYYQTANAMINGIGVGPALMRVRNQGLPTVVAFGITNFQVVYILRNGTETTVPVLPPPVTAQTIERIRLTVTGETRNAHSLTGEAPSKRTRTMTTEVQVRNLAF